MDGTSEARVTDQPDFRAYTPYCSRDAEGRPVILQLCEELVDGRWEPFLTTRQVALPDPLAERS